PSRRPPTSSAPAATRPRRGARSRRSRTSSSTWATRAARQPSTRRSHSSRPARRARSASPRTRRAPAASPPPARRAAARAAAERALALGGRLGLEEPARALGYRGSARCLLGDAGGLDDVRRALEICVERARGRDAAVQFNNLALALWAFDGPATALEVGRQGI